jgi:uncharacterized protein YkwD
MQLSWRKRLAVLLGVGALLGATVQPALASVPSPAVAAADAQTVFRTINRERAAHHLPGLRWNAALASVARAHNINMARLDTLSHQLPGEPGIGVQISTAGYEWRALGENIAAGSDMSLTGVLNLQRMLFHEVAPNDPHRRNILSRVLRAVGVDVRMDGPHNTVWLTEVFAQPS